MTRYILFKHYRGAPAASNDSPMSDWSDKEIQDHIAFMDQFAEQLKSTGEYVDSQALSPDAEFVRAGADGAAESRDVDKHKALVAGWMIIDVADRDRAHEVAAELSAAPGSGGHPVGEWLEVRAFHGDA